MPVLFNIHNEVRLCNRKFSKVARFFLYGVLLNMLMYKISKILLQYFPNASNKPLAKNDPVYIYFQILMICFIAYMLRLQIILLYSFYPKNNRYFMELKIEKNYPTTHTPIQQLGILVYTVGAFRSLIAVIKLLRLTRTV